MLPGSRSAEGWRGRLARLAAQDGWQVTPVGEIAFGDAPLEASEMAALALDHGWDLVYTNEKGLKELLAVNGDTRVSRAWDAKRRSVRTDGLDRSYCNSAWILLS